MPVNRGTPFNVQRLNVVRVEERLQSRKFMGSAFFDIIAGRCFIYTLMSLLRDRRNVVAARLHIRHQLSVKIFRALQK